MALLKGLLSSEQQLRAFIGGGRGREACALGDIITGSPPWPQVGSLSHTNNGIVRLLEGQESKTPPGTVWMSRTQPGTFVGQGEQRRMRAWQPGGHPLSQLFGSFLSLFISLRAGIPEGKVCLDN